MSKKPDKKADPPHIFMNMNHKLATSCCGAVPIFYRSGRVTCSKCDQAVESPTYCDRCGAKWRTCGNPKCGGKAFSWNRENAREYVSVSKADLQANKTLVKGNVETAPAVCRTTEIKPKKPLKPIEGQLCLLEYIRRGTHSPTGRPSSGGSIRRPGFNS